MNDARDYRILFNPDAWKDLMKLPERVQDSVFDKIYFLELNPRPSGCKKLKGNSGYYRVRVGNFRVIYDIQDEKLIVVVAQVIDRKEGYD